MGKSTAAQMLEHLGIPVHDSDAGVHHLLAEDINTRKAIMAAFPRWKYFAIYGRKDKTGLRSINRKKLGEIIFKTPKHRETLEQILHPRIHESQNAFLREQHAASRDIVALDIPLLFETGADKRVDITITVSAPAFIQRSRVMARPGMSEEKLGGILARQMPDEEKCARADYVLPSGLGRAHMMKTLKQIIHDLRTIRYDDEHLEESTSHDG